MFSDKEVLIGSEGGDRIVKADLHTHTTYSDGSETIDRVIETAKSEGLDAVAITDHDTVSHMAHIPTGAGIKVVAGTEISAIHRKTGTRAHVLGYNIGKPEIIKALTSPLLEARTENTEKQAGILIGIGFQIDMDKLSRADGKYLYKQNVMDWLVKTGQVPEMFGDFYKKTFRGGGVCAFDIEYIDVFEAVRAVKEAGGLAVLAHPDQQKNFWLIPELVNEGLDGLELNHHSSSPDGMITIRDYANRFNLFLTGGSDFHGRFAPFDSGVGRFLSEESGASAIC